MYIVFWFVICFTLLTLLLLLRVNCKDKTDAKNHPCINRELGYVNLIPTIMHAQLTTDNLIKSDT